MPHTTGLELAGKMLKIRPDIPIVLCTGHSETITEEKVREAGIRAFAMKPVSRGTLAKVIRRVLGEKEKGVASQEGVVRNCL